VSDIAKHGASAEEISSAKCEPSSGADGRDSALITALRESDAIARRDPKAWDFPLSDEPFVIVSELERQVSPFRTMFEEESSLKILEIITGAALELGRRALKEQDEAAAKVAMHCLVRGASVAANEASVADNYQSRQALLHEVAATYPAWPVVLALTSKVPESISVKSAENYLKKLKVGTQSVLKGGSVGKKENLNTKQAHVAYLHARLLIECLARLRRFASLVKPPDEDPVLRRLVKRLNPLIGAIPIGDDHAFGKWCKTAIRTIQKMIPAPGTNTHLLSLVEDLDGFSRDGTLKGKIRFRRADRVLVYDLRKLRDLIWTCPEQALYQWRTLRFTEMMHAVAQTSKPLHADKAAKVPRPRQVCPWSGLRRGMINQLIREGRIRSVCLRQPGRLRGKRLVYLPSVLELLRCNMEGGGSE
jgi:hypothetical protein